MNEEEIAKLSDVLMLMTKYAVGLREGKIPANLMNAHDISVTIIVLANKAAELLPEGKKINDLDEDLAEKLR